MTVSVDEWESARFRHHPAPINISQGFDRVKVLIIGKYRSIVNWPENLSHALRHSGAEVSDFAMNGAQVLHSLRYKIAGKLTGNNDALMCDDLARQLKTFQPDRVIFIVIAALFMPPRMFELVREICPDAHSTAWVGDRLTPREFGFAGLVDHVAVTDTAFMDDLRAYGYQTAASYLPLAVDTRRFHPMPVQRGNQVVYAANNSPGRGALIAKIPRRLTLYGKGWSRLDKPTPHDIHARRLPYARLPEVYAGSLAVLNIRNEKNVINGLNQRSFEPYGCQTPVLNDDMADLPHCFEPGTEILVWRNLEELVEHYDRLQADPAFARRIGEAGYKRVLHEHTYAHRAHTLLALS